MKKRLSTRLLCLLLLGALTFLSGRPINMELAHSCIAELIGGGEPTNVTIDKVFSAIFKKYSRISSSLYSATRRAVPCG